jgi:phosphoribosyl-dephospho-CoA transferase
MTASRPVAMPPLRRHQLAHLAEAGWRDIFDRDWDVDTAACLNHWAEHTLPLVVTRQRSTHPSHDGLIALGLAAPACWGRRPIALQVAADHIVGLSEFPTLGEVAHLLPRTDGPPLQTLFQTLQRLGVPAHVYGSVGWQQLSGLSYLHESSDLDLWLAVASARQADAAVAALAACDSSMRLDGELMLADGSAVAWREWAAWRAGRCDRVLVKRLFGAALESTPEALWPTPAHAPHERRMAQQRRSTASDV